MTVKELKNFLKSYGKDMILKSVTPNPKINTPIFNTVVYSKDEDIMALKILEDCGRKLTAKAVLDFINVCEGLSDDTLVTVCETNLGTNNANLLRWFSVTPYSSYIGINSKADEDVFEEIAARMENAKLSGSSDADFIQCAFDDGITLNDFKEYDKSAYEFATRTKEEFGLVELAERRKNEVLEPKR